MARTPRPWTVTPHGPLVKHDENLWSVTGDVPTIPGFTRIMQVARLGDGRLLFHNGVPLDNATLNQVKALGTPAILVVPNQEHNLDVAAFRERLGLTAYGPAQTCAAIAGQLPIADYGSFPADDLVRLETLEGLKNGEVAVAVKSRIASTCSSGTR